MKPLNMILTTKESSETQNKNLKTLIWIALTQIKLTYIYVSNVTTLSMDQSEEIHQIKLETQNHINKIWRHRFKSVLERRANMIKKCGEISRPGHHAHKHLAAAFQI